MKPFLILQARPEQEAANDEYQAILDKGGLVASDVRRIGLDHERVPVDLDLESFAGVIVGGGPPCFSDPPEKQSVVERRIEMAALSLMPRIVANDFPFLGCCYGIGLLATHLGGTVSKARFSEPVGTSDCRLTDAGRQDPLLAGMDDRFLSFVGHKEALQELPSGCVHLIESDPCPFQMIRYANNVYATQFHPEADATSFAVRIRIYRQMGYFPPEDADRLIALCADASVNMPERILANFVTRYG